MTQLNQILDLLNNKFKDKPFEKQFDLLLKIKDELEEDDKSFFNKNDPKNIIRPTVISSWDEKKNFIYEQLIQHLNFKNEETIISEEQISILYKKFGAVLSQKFMLNAINNSEKYENLLISMRWISENTKDYFFLQEELNKKNFILLDEFHQKGKQLLGNNFYYVLNHLFFEKYEYTMVQPRPTNVLNNCFQDLYETYIKFNNENQVIKPIFENVSNNFLNLINEGLAPYTMSSHNFILYFYKDVILNLVEKNQYDLPSLKITEMILDKIFPIPINNLESREIKSQSDVEKIFENVCHRADILNSIFSSISGSYKHNENNDLIFTDFIKKEKDLFVKTTKIILKQDKTLKNLRGIQEGLDLYFEQLPNFRSKNQLIFNTLNNQNEIEIKKSFLNSIMESNDFKINNHLNHNMYIFKNIINKVFKLSDENERIKYLTNIIQKLNPEIKEFKEISKIKDFETIYKENEEILKQISDNKIIEKARHSLDFFDQVKNIALKDPMFKKEYKEILSVLNKCEIFEDLYKEKIQTIENQQELNSQLKNEIDLDLKQIKQQFKQHQEKSLKKLKDLI